jgi:hypothetical protein
MLVKRLATSVLRSPAKYTPECDHEASKMRRPRPIRVVEPSKRMPEEVRAGSII